MRIVNKIETFDGELHDEVDDAISHVENIYGKKLTAIAHAIVGLDWRYTAVLEYIDKHLVEFVQLYEIRKDLQMDKETEK